MDIKLILDSILLVVVLVIFYAFFIRPILIRKNIVDEINFSTLFKDIKIILVSRLIAISGIAISMYDLVIPYLISGNFDSTDLKIPAWLWPVLLSLLGLLMEYLKRLPHQTEDE